MQLLAIAAMTVWASAAPPAEPLPDRGELLPVPAYSQNDARWARDRVGGSNETLKKVGCVVTSVAMVFDYFGVPTTPKTLNKWLRKHRGYSSRGWLSWHKAAKFAGNRLELAWFGRFDKKILDRHLAAGNPAIVKTRSMRNSTHWVLVIGKRERDGAYMALDPLRRDGKAVPLKRISKANRAMRIYAPREPGQQAARR